MFHYSFFRLAFGNECGLAIIDTFQKTCLLNMGTPDLYGKEVFRGINTFCFVVVVAICHEQKIC